jgi:hypothetical protein
MITYLFLIVFFGLLGLIGIGSLVFGLVKKQKALLVISAILLVIGISGGIFSGFMYAKKAVQYVKSDEFQDDARKGSEMVGETIGSTTSGLSKGFSKTLDDEAIMSLASKSATIFGKVTKTVASNLDSTLGNKNVYLDKSVENSGLEFGRAEEKYNAQTNDLGIFIEFKKDFKKVIRIANYDQTGKIIESVEKAISAKAGQSKVEVFSFLLSDLGMTTYYIISLPEY